MGTAPLHSQGDPSGACFCYAAHSQAQPPREWQGWSQSPGREPLSVAPRPPTPAATPGAGILEKGTGSERCFPPWVRTGPAGPPLCDDSATGATLRPSITLGGAKLSRDLEGHTPRPRLGPLADGGPPQRTGQTLPVTRPPSHAGAPPVRSLPAWAASHVPRGPFLPPSVTWQIANILAAQAKEGGEQRGAGCSPS